jgi:hypothetical protein
VIVTVNMNCNANLNFNTTLLNTQLVPKFAEIGTKIQKYICKKYLTFSVWEHLNNLIPSQKVFSELKK